MVIFCVKANGDNKDGLFRGLEGVGEVILVMKYGNPNTISLFFFNGAMEDHSHLTDYSVS